MLTRWPLPRWRSARLDPHKGAGLEGHFAPEVFGTPIDCQAIFLSPLAVHSTQGVFAMCVFLPFLGSLGLDGVIAKHRDRSYCSGRGGDALKIKHVHSESFFIVGYEPSSSALGGIGALLLAAYEGHDIVYVGSVGTSFNDA